MRVLDLFSGTGGWSQAFLERGHDVTRIELDPQFASVPCTTIADVRSYYAAPGDFDVILASLRGSRIHPAGPCKHHPKGPLDGRLSIG